MISSNIDNLCSKCYLNFVKIVADKMQSNRVSNANININSGVLNYKKINKNITCFHSQTLELIRSVYL